MREAWLVSFKNAFGHEVAKDWVGPAGLKKLEGQFSSVVDGLREKLEENDKLVKELKEKTDLAYVVSENLRKAISALESL